MFPSRSSDVFRAFTKCCLRLRNPKLKEARSCVIESCLIARGGKVAVGPHSVVRFGAVLMLMGANVHIVTKTTINKDAVLYEPAVDAVVTAEVIQILVEDSHLRDSMARARAQSYRLSGYGNHLVNVVF